jgi:hypothetical protein
MSLTAWQSSPAPGRAHVLDVLQRELLQDPPLYPDVVQSAIALLSAPIPTPRAPRGPKSDATVQFYHRMALGGAARAMAFAEIDAAIAKTGSITKAALELHVPVRTLFRWLAARGPREASEPAR